MIVDKKTRDDAAYILSICASNHVSRPTACDWLDIDLHRPSARLALYAFISAPAGLTNPEMYADAESRVRTGWVP